jgi:hypothetical protein
VIDADASPSGYVAWYNHHSKCSRIRGVRPTRKDEEFGIQRMEMLAIYFAIADNLKDIRRKTTRYRRNRVLIAVRSDSKSTVEQLLGLSKIRDTLIRRIFFAIGKLLTKIRHMIIFDHLERSYNTAGILLEQYKMKEGKWRMMNDFHMISTIMPAAASYI